jgi:hypothetical protein
MRVVARSGLPILVLAALVLVVACSNGTATVDTAEVVASVPFEGSVNERLEYRLIEAGEELGQGTLTTERTEDGWRFEQRYTSATVESASDLSVALVDGQLRPLASERTITHEDGRVDVYAVEYRPADERYVSTVIEAGAEPEVREFELREHAYDNESSLWLWRTLDLREDFEARYVSVNPFERSQQTVDLSVTERATIEVPAGEFEVWRVQILNGRATRIAWIQVESPHLIVQWDNGASFLQLVDAQIAVE